MAAEIKYRVNNQKDVWLTDDVYRWNLPNTTLTMLWVDVIADGDITVVEQKKEDWCRFSGRDDKGDFYRYWFSFINNSGYERRNEYEFSTTVGDETASFTLKIIQKGTLPTPTIAENLNRIIQAKNGIKQAIENKGVTVGDMTIDGYAEKINEITGGGKWVVPDGTKFSESTFVTFDGSSLDVSNLTTFKLMFDSCSNLTTVGDLSGWDVSKATSLMFLFNRCSSLKSVDTIKDWNVSNVKQIVGLFANCSKLSSVQAIKDWDVSNVEQLGNLFDGCSNLTSIDLSSWRINAPKILDADYMFRNCTSLIEVKMGFDVSKIDEVYTNISTMFEGVNTTGTFYYNSEYDYSKIIAVLPSGWTAVPM